MKLPLMIASLGLAGVALPGSAQAIANPASTLCVKVGGKSVAARLNDGSMIGLCYLPKDRVIEEWTLFRMLDGKPPRRGHALFR